MKKYEVYRNIRKGAVIWGLPISLFALFMVSVVASLLIIIFSFGFLTVIGLFLWNIGLFAVLGKLKTLGASIQFQRVFPKSISNKKDNILNYVNY